MTPIDALKEMVDRKPYTTLDGAPDIAYVQEVLVPEQCMIVWMNGRAYHVTVEPIEQMPG